MVRTKSLHNCLARILATLVCSLCLASPAVRADDFDGIGFYPPGDNPNCSVSVWGPVVKGAVIVNKAYFSPNLTSVLLTPDGEKLGIGKKYVKGRMSVNIPVDANKPGFHANVVDLMIYYPHNLKAMPNVKLKVAGALLDATCLRDPGEHNLDGVKAILRLPPTVANDLKFGNILTLQVFTSSGVLLEQATIQICNQQAFAAMVSDAKKALLEKSATGLH